MFPKKHIPKTFAAGIFFGAMILFSAGCGTKSETENGVKKSESTSPESVSSESVSPKPASPVTISPEAVELFPEAVRLLELAEKISAEHKEKFYWAEEQCRIAACWIVAGDRKRGVEKFKEIFEKTADSEVSGLAYRQLEVIVRMISEGASLEAEELLRPLKDSVSKCMIEMAAASREQKAGNREAAGKRLRQAEEMLRTKIGNDSELRQGWNDPRGTMLISFMKLAQECGEDALIISVYDSLPDELKEEFTRFVAPVLARRGITAANVEEMIQQAEAMKDDAKVPFLRPVLHFYLKAGDTKSAEALLERVFPAGGKPTSRGGDELALFGRRSGRDMLLESLAIAQTQYGRLAEARKALARIEEPGRKALAMRKVSSILSDTEDPVRTVFAGVLGPMAPPDSMLGGDMPRKDIPRPDFTPKEVREFYLWMRDNPPVGPDREETFMLSGWYCGLAVPMAKTGNLKDARQTVEIALKCLTEKERAILKAGEANYWRPWKDYFQIMATQHEIGDQAEIAKTITLWEAAEQRKADALAKNREEDDDDEFRSFRERHDYEYYVLGFYQLELPEEAEKYLAKIPEDRRDHVRNQALFQKVQKQLQDGQVEEARSALTEYLAHLAAQNPDEEMPMPDVDTLLRQLGMPEAPDQEHISPRSMSPEKLREAVAKLKKELEQNVKRDERFKKESGQTDGDNLHSDLEMTLMRLRDLYRPEEFSRERMMNADMLR